MRVKSSVRKIVSRASKMEKWPHICPKILGCNTLCTFYIWFEHKLKSFPCIQSKISCCPAEAGPYMWASSMPTQIFPGCICSFKEELPGQQECSAHPGPLATFLPCMPASQMASSQETACLSMLDGTQKSPRVIVSYWHLGQALSFPRGYSVNPVWKKAWRHSSKHSLDISKVLHGQMESLCLSICRLKAQQINLWSIATSVHSLPTVSNIS